MPTMPSETKALDNGKHTLTALEVKTTTGTYGPQEEVTCCTDAGTLTHVWIGHNSRKKIDAAIGAGLAKLEPNNQEWNIVIGARFDVFVAGGKIIALMPATTPAPAPVAPVAGVPVNNFS